MQSPYRRHLQILTIGLLVIMLDYATKQWAAARDMVTINQGSIFGLFGGSDEVNIVLTLIIMTILVWLAKLSRLFSAMQQLWLAAAVAAGFANLLDRILWGGVRDWLTLPLVNLRNNLADWILFVSVLGLLVSSYKRKQQ